MAFKTHFVALYSILLTGTLKGAFADEFAVLAAESFTEKENFCLIYYPEFSVPPSQKSQAKFHILQDESSQDFCNDSPSRNDFHGKFVLLRRSNCSLAEQARIVEEQNGEGALFITPSGKVDHIDVNTSAASFVNITVALISENSVQKLKDMGSSVTARIFAPKNFSFDFSLLTIWVIAMFTLSVGSYWSGLVRLSLYNKEISKLPDTGTTNPVKPPSQYQASEESSLNVSPYSIGVFVLCMGLMLMLLYFFFDYLVYVIIGLFALASFIAMYNCLEPLFLRIPFNCCKLPAIRCGNNVVELDVKQIILLTLSFSTSVTWVVLRREKYSWILQDVLGVAFCIYMLKSIRLPNLKICAILLILLFFYDIFFVFITPFLTMKGESVMEEVATGGKSSEMLPMVLKVAHFGFDPLTVCYQQFSLLGFGDILIPGLLVSYLHGFDLIRNTGRIYFKTTAPMYGGGLLLTFAGLYYMNSAQPALLYLVPCTLIPPVLIGWLRGELSLLWKGFKPQKPSEPSSNAVGVTQNVEEANTVQNSDVSPLASQTASCTSFDKQVIQDGSVTEISVDSHGEKKHLLR